MTVERDLRGTNFVFFGGSTGLGHATALEIGRRGADVLIVGRGRAAGEAAATEIKAAGAASADFLAGDLSTVAGATEAAAGVKRWRPELHGVMHTALSVSRTRKTTADGLESHFAIGYLARAVINRLLVDELAASGDGRILHGSGSVRGIASKLFMPDLDDLQFERRTWGFFKSMLPNHQLNYFHVQEAARRWADRPVTLTLFCVGPTKTKVMGDKNMHPVNRLAVRFGMPPERSARNAVRVLTAASAQDVNGTVLRNATSFSPEKLAMDTTHTAKLWDITGTIAAEHGTELP
ncbi:SDR family NAD(P)-dependent oxidoreductase [Streptomyces sp. NPDC046909]|uniref:SDR family NAD(P)-dependent oxidoreductase n=1 Tax=Streptomyces sp. NPDC046909 TaxID=3155617 RepID=UPI0033F51C02